MKASSLNKVRVADDAPSKVALIKRCRSLKTIATRDLPESCVDVVVIAVMDYATKEFVVAPLADTQKLFRLRVPTFLNRFSPELTPKEKVRITITHGSNGQNKDVGYMEIDKIHDDVDFENYVPSKEA